MILKPGTKLNDAVTLKVFGHELSPHDSSADYSYDCDDNEIVRDWLVRNRHVIIDCLCKDDEQHWTVLIENYNPVVGETLEHAICLAAIQVAEVEEGMSRHE